MEKIIRTSKQSQCSVPQNYRLKIQQQQLIANRAYLEQLDVHLLQQAIVFNQDGRNKIQRQRTNAFCEQSTEPSQKDKQILTQYGYPFHPQLKTHSTGEDISIGLSAIELILPSARQSLPFLTFRENNSSKMNSARYANSSSQKSRENQGSKSARVLSSHQKQYSLVSAPQHSQIKTLDKYNGDYEQQYLNWISKYQASIDGRRCSSIIHNYSYKKLNQFQSDFEQKQQQQQQQVLTQRFRKNTQSQAKQYQITQSSSSLLELKQQQIGQSKSSFLTKISTEDRIKWICDCVYGKQQNNCINNNHQDQCFKQPQDFQQMLHCDYKKEERNEDFVDQLCVEENKIIVGGQVDQQVVEQIYLEKGKEQSYEQQDQKKIRIQEIISSMQGILQKLEASNNNVDKQGIILNFDDYRNDNKNNNNHDHKNIDSVSLNQKNNHFYQDNIKDLESITKDTIRFDSSEEHRINYQDRIQPQDNINLRSNQEKGQDNDDLDYDSSESYVSSTMSPYSMQCESNYNNNNCLSPLIYPNTAPQRTINEYQYSLLNDGIINKEQDKDLFDEDQNCYQYLKITPKSNNNMNSSSQCCAFDMNQYDSAQEGQLCLSEQDKQLKQLIAQEQQEQEQHGRYYQEQQIVNNEKDKSHWKYKPLLDPISENSILEDKIPTPKQQQQQQQYCLQQQQ